MFNYLPEDLRNREYFTRGDMDIVGNLFGLIIRKEEYEVRGEKHSHYMAYLFTEDDENYFFKHSFNAVWLRDLRRVAADGDSFLAEIKGRQ